MIRCILKKFRLDNEYYKLLLDSDWHQLNIRRPNNPDPRYQWEIRSTKRELLQVLLLTTTAYIVSHIIEVIKIEIVTFDRNSWICCQSQRGKKDNKVSILSFNKVSPVLLELLLAMW